MSYNPTIVAASLSDEDLQKSIDKLVKKVDDGCLKMMMSMDTAVEHMKKSLNSLGNVNINMGGGAVDGGASRRTKAQQEEKKAVMDTAVAYDNLSQAQQKATRGGKKGVEYMTLQSDIDKDLTYLVNVNKDVDAQMSAILRKEQELIEAKQKEAQITERIAQAQKTVTGTAQINQSVHEMQRNSAISSNSKYGSGISSFAQFDDLQIAIARTLRIQQQQVKVVDETYDSYNKLSASLKQLKSAYNTLNESERNSDNGKALLRRIQVIEREAQKIQAQASRPINLESVLGLSTKTLDDMAYKLRQLQSYKMGLNVKTQVDEMMQVDREIVRLKKRYDELMSKNQQMVASNTALGRSWNYMKNRLAFYFTVGASTQFIKNLIEVRSQYEMNERALGILINSAERGSLIFKELSDMALVSPYTLIELSTAAKQLTAYDIAAKDVVDTTRRLADMTAAVGIPIERLTYAIGQVKAYGYLNARDARMFSNAGIPLVKELADYYTQLEGRIVSVSDVYDKINKKAIDYNSVMSVVTKMTDEGGKFFDFQAKMAGTLKVQLANLTLAWNNMLNDIGASEQGMLSGVIGGLKNLFLQWKSIDNILTKVVYTFGLYKLAQMFALAFTGRLTTAMGMQELVGAKLQARLASLTTSTTAFAKASTLGWVAVAAVVTDVLYTMSQNADEINRLNQGIADGAKESAESLGKILESAEMVQNRLSAQNGKLPKSDAEKTWEVLREQIELSSASAKDIIPQLIAIENENERLTAAFNLAERIKSANEKLSDMFDNLNVSQNSILGGLFGEGVVEDIDDYNEHLKYLAETEEYAAKKTHSFWENAAMGIYALFNEVKDALGSDTKEAQSEIEKFAHNAADVIRDELGEEGIKDKVQVNEAIARIMQGMEKQFPQIRGKGKLLFETMFNDIMASEFTGAVDKQAYYYNLFLERLKKDHASAFQGVTNGILEDTHVWSSAQENAIQKTAEKIKKDMPAASQDAINSILKQLNSTDFKIRIVTQFATTTEDEVNKQFRDKFINRPYLEDQKERERQENEAMQKYGTLMKKNNENDLEYQKRIIEEKQKKLDISRTEGSIIEKNKGKQDEASKAILANAEEAKAAADEILSAIDDVEKWGGYDFTTKKESAAAKKERLTAEKEVSEALKQELSLLKDMQSNYDKLRKAGVDNTTAIDLATRGYGQTLTRVNTVLQKYGISKFNAKDFLGKDVNSVLRTLERQRSDALVSGRLKTGALKDLDVEIQKLNVDAKTYNMDKITKGLNNELGKLKDEYELAVELDTNPELGGVFADMMGLGDEQLKNLPRTFEDVLKKMQGKIDEQFGENKFNLAANLNKNVFDSWVEANGMQLESEQVKALKSYVDYANKVRQDETKKQIEEWNKLLEKYAEYEYKRKQILDEYNREMETARKKNADKSITDAIENRKNERLADLDFNEFMKTSEWITATGDLANMSKSAIGMLIQQIEAYRKTAKNLSPKQIKQLNQALKKLYTEQRKNNPFKAISNMLDEAKSRMAVFDEEIQKVEKEILDIENSPSQDNIAERASKLEELRKKYEQLKEEQEKVGKIDATSWVSAINETVGAVQEAVNVFNDLAKAITGVESTEVDKVFSVLTKMGSTAATGAVVGGWIGAVVGAALGAATSIISMNADDEKERFDNYMKGYELHLKRLENAYKDLEYEVDHAFGTAIIGAKHAAIANKELQIQNLKLQLELEESRRSKDRDNDRIEDLRSQIHDLELDIKNTIEEIVNDLLGISSIGDAAENMIGVFIEALRSGEDAMDKFSENVDEMIVNMIKKLVTTKIIAPKIQEIFDDIEARINNRYKTQEAAMKRAEYNYNINTFGQNPEDVLPTYTKQERMDIYKAWYKRNGMEFDENTFDESAFKITRDFREWWYKYSIQYWAEKLKEEQEKLEHASDWDVKDIDYAADRLNELKPTMEAGQDFVKELLERYGLMKDSSKSLSALQQGIQGITEDTAGALEAYMNGVSQQVYLQSEYLRQITEILSSHEDEALDDVKVATLSQILLQLRSSYETQQAIHSLLDGWNNDSGRAIRVELIS